LNGETLFIYTNSADKLFKVIMDAKDVDILNKYDARVEINYNRTKIPYAAIKVDKKTGARRMLHRVIMNAPPGKVVDHINHNTLDNRKDNLRIVSYVENARNRAGLNRNNKSGYPGLRWHTEINKWVATIKINYKEIYLGAFINKEDAINIIKAARERYYV